MTATAVQALIDAGTVVISVCASAFIAGVRFGAVSSDMKAINERLARIEGMFTLRLKGNDQ